MKHLPNILSLVRIALVPVIVALFFIGQPWSAWTAFALFLLAAVTDWLDGWLARKYALDSLLGRILDPIADKLLVGAVLIALIGFGHVGQVTMLAALIILLRELTVSGLREVLAGEQISLPVTRLAKWKTTVQMVALAVLILARDGPAFLRAAEIGAIALWIAALLTALTGWDYLKAALTHAANKDGLS